MVPNKTSESTESHSVHREDKHYRYYEVYRTQKERSPKEETAGKGTGLEDFLVEANLKLCSRFATGKSESRTD